jgi:hypothetical protein
MRHMVSARLGLTLAMVGLAASALAGCSSSGKDTAGSLSTVGPTPTVTVTATVTATQTVTASPAPASSAPSGPSGPGYDAARTAWQQGASSSSAQEGAFWKKAATDLTGAVSSDTGDTSGYALAAADLLAMLTLPDAQQSPAQNAAFLAGVSALDAFFNTPNLYS